MLASVIIPTSGDPLRLPWCLESLTRQSNQDFELIIINDGGYKRIEKVIAEYKVNHFGGRLIYDYLPKGKKKFRAAMARNHGVKLSKGETLIFLDQDCVAFPEMVAEHCQKTDWNRIGQGLRLRLPLAKIGELKDFSYRWLFDNAEMNDLSESMTLGNLFSFNISINAKSFCRIGGFDEDYVGWGGEDLDLGHRLLKMSFKRFVVDIQGLVIHLDHEKHEANKKWRELFYARMDGAIERNGGRLVRLCDA